MAGWFGHKTSTPRGIMDLMRREHRETQLMMQQDLSVVQPIQDNSTVAERPKEGQPSETTPEVVEEDFHKYLDPALVQDLKIEAKQSDERLDEVIDSHTLKMVDYDSQLTKLVKSMVITPRAQEQHPAYYPGIINNDIDLSDIEIIGEKINHQVDYSKKKADQDQAYKIYREKFLWLTKIKLEAKQKAEEQRRFGFDITETQIEEEPEVLEQRPTLEELNEFWQTHIRSVSEGTVLVENFDIPIKRSDLETLTGLNWLNDEIINYYFNLIKESVQSDRKIHIFNTFFYAKIGSGANYFQGIRRWTRKVDIFGHELVLIPLHLGLHWTLAAVFMEQKRIIYYDSMNGGPVNQGGREHLEKLLDYLRKEHQDKKGQPLPDGWGIGKVGFDQDGQELDLPQQGNGSDCGMFTCMFARFLAENRRFVFSQEHMPYLRKKFAYEIINKELC